MGWFALAPWLGAAAGAESPRRAAASGWLFGAALSGTHFYWIYSTCRFAGVPVPAAALAWGALALLAGSPWAAFGALARMLRGNSRAAWPWACAAAWAAIEFAVSPLNLGLFKLGYTQWKHLAWIQGASWAGPHALGFLVMLANAVLASWWIGEGKRRALALTTVAAAACLAAWWGWGAWALAGRRMAAPERLVAILQPNVDQYQKWDEGYEKSIRSNLDDLLAQAGQKRPELVVWPETSVPGWLDEPEYLRWVSGWARRTKAHHLVGALTREPFPGDGLLERNSAALVGPGGEISGYYHKRRLVPFGEFVPLRRLLAPFVGILARMGDLEPGPASQPPFETPLGRLGVTICYEAGFPRLTRSAAAAGARIVVNVTNDGWYKDTWGPAQHFYANVFRAVENRVTVVRAANTGISGVIDPYGVVTARLDLGRRGVLIGAVPGADPFPSRSFYARHGDWFGWLSAALALAFVIWAVYNSGESPR